MARIEWAPVRRSPWCPLAVADSPSVPVAAALSFRKLDNDVVVFDSFRRLAGPCEAVRNRPVPDPAMFCRFLSLRSGTTELGRVVMECISNGDRGTLSRTIHRKLAESGSRDALRASDWRHLWRLATLSPKPQESIAMLADRYGCDERTLRNHLRRLVGMSPRGFRQLVGWEWIVEAALRQHGYLTGLRSSSDTSPVRGSSQRSGEGRSAPPLRRSTHN